MIYFVFADIHGILTGLQVVIEDTKKVLSSRQDQECKYIFLGDMFGRGPFPVQVFAYLSHLENLTWIIGNHDRAVYDESYRTGWRYSADLEIITLHNQVLARSNQIIEKLRYLPVVEQVDNFLISHGFPGSDERQSLETYERHAMQYPDRIIQTWGSVYPKANTWLVGHSHRQTLWSYRKSTSQWLLKPVRVGGRTEDFGQTFGGQNGHFQLDSDGLDRYHKRIRIEKSEINDSLFIINPGSVGFPRDGKPSIIPENRSIAKYLIIEELDEFLILEFVALTYENQGVIDAFKSGNYPMDIINYYLR